MDRLRSGLSGSCWGRFCAFALASLVLALVSPGELQAQSPGSAGGAPGDGWSTGVAPGIEANPSPAIAAPPANPQDGNVTVVPRDPGLQGKDGAGRAPVQLVALLTADGQRIDQGLVWRIYKEDQSSARGSAPLSTLRESSPTVELAPGTYIVNAAFGRAHLTRRIKVDAPATVPLTEQFVLNAGGLRVTAMVGGKPAAAGTVHYAIYTDRDQTDNRRLVMPTAKPDLIIRLNAGIYHIVSTLGDANAVVRSDVTVEAGKLTEATLVHTFARATFKLVTRAGGEAIPGTEWSVQTPEGQTVKESVGALPTHTVAPGNYVVIAKSQGKAYRKDISLLDGQSTQVELVIP